MLSRFVETPGQPAPCRISGGRTPVAPEERHERSLEHCLMRGPTTGRILRIQDVFAQTAIQQLGQVQADRMAVGVFSGAFELSDALERADGHHDPHRLLSLAHDFAITEPRLNRAVRGKRHY